MAARSRRPAHQSSLFSPTRLVLVEPLNGRLGRGDTEPGAHPHQLVPGSRVGNSDLGSSCLDGAVPQAETKAGSKEGELSRCWTWENLARRPKKKVVGPNASTSAAAVEHIGSIRDRAIFELPGEPMGPDHPTAVLGAYHAELSIAETVGRAGPHPAIRTRAHHRLEPSASWPG
jgi:hypothetical protein